MRILQCIPFNCRIPLIKGAFEQRPPEFPLSMRQGRKIEACRGKIESCLLIKFQEVGVSDAAIFKSFFLILVINVSQKVFVLEVEHFHFVSGLNPSICIQGNSISCTNSAPWGFPSKAVPVKSNVFKLVDETHLSG